MTVATSVLDDRPGVADCLHAALAALQAEAARAWRSNVDELLRWPPQPLVQGLAILAPELEHAFGNIAGDHERLSLCGHGPSIVHLDPHAATQDDAKQLLSACGL